MDEVHQMKRSQQFPTPCVRVRARAGACLELSRIFPHLIHRNFHPLELPDFAIWLFSLVRCARWTCFTYKMPNKQVQLTGDQHKFNLTWGWWRPACITQNCESQQYAVSAQNASEAVLGILPRPGGGGGPPRPPAKQNQNKEMSIPEENRRHEDYA